MNCLMYLKDLLSEANCRITLSLSMTNKLKISSTLKENIMLKHILFIIVMLFSSKVVFTQSTSLVTPTEISSFRNNALGGIVNDDLDLIYDPVELNYVRNLHIFTNLSNLTSTNEQIFNNQNPGDNMLLFGISRENPFVPNLTHAVLFQFQKSQDPGFINI